MNFSKRILSIFLALFIFISVNLTSVSAVTSVSADTDTTYTSGDYQYKILDDGTIEITDYFGTNTNVIIPTTIDGYIVSKLGEKCFYNTEIQNVTIPNSVTVIERGAFDFCRNLQYVYIPESITEICDITFQSCTSLTSVTIPNGVKSIGKCAFNRCSSLSTVSLPESVITINEYAFFGCENLKKVIIPATVTELGSYNFGLYSDLGYSYRYKDFIIYGYPSTAGEAYAVENEIRFIPLDKGDADESTAVDIKDVTCMQKIIAKITVTNDFKTANCDLNGDGKLNIRDATLLQLYLAKKIDKFPVQE